MPNPNEPIPQDQNDPRDRALQRVLESMGRAIVAIERFIRESNTTPAGGSI